MNSDGNGQSAALVERVEICDCTNTQLERGETCGRGSCPNAPRNAWHPRLNARAEALAAVPTARGRIDGVALGLLAEHGGFNRDCFAWIGSEHLGGGVFCASAYTGTEADSPYLWITAGEEDPKKFLACVFVGPADGEEEAEDPFLVAECGVKDLAAESLRMLDSAKRLAAGGEGESA